MGDKKYHVVVSPGFKHAVLVALLKVGVTGSQLKCCK